MTRILFRYVKFLTRTEKTVWPLQLLLNVIMVISISNSSNAQEPVDFAHQIFPIFKTKCSECHSNGVFKGGLSLETRDDLIDSGSVVVGSRDDSDLYSRITSTDHEYQMPPEGDRLSAEEVSLIGKWIDDGIEWPAEITLKKATFKRSLELHPAANETTDDDSTNLIDQVVNDYFVEHAIDWPAELDDQQFFRRAKLDLLGLLPSIDELAEFAADQRPGKRAILIDELLSRNRGFSDHWISFWNDMLRNDYAGTGYIDGGRQQITEWLYQALLENKPYDTFVRELINPSPASEGFIKGIKWRGEINASQIEPLQFSQNVSQVFLGINMKCASCHDSFIDDWKLEDAYGLAAIIADQPLEMHRCDVPTGKIATSKFVFPELGEIDNSLASEKRLEKFAQLLTSEKNGRFSRTIVNRLWERMTGRGLVHPVDVMANEAWSEVLLDRLAIDLIAHDYNLKHTLRLIATSRVYGARSVAFQQDETQRKFVFRGLQAKRMTAEQFVDAVWQITGAGPTQMDAVVTSAESSNNVSGDEQLTAVMIRAALVNSNELMRSLGRPNREQVVTTRPAELSTLQALDLSNGELLTGWLRVGAESLLKTGSENGLNHEQLLRQIFLKSLSREPTNQEADLLRIDENTGVENDDLQQSVEDLLWIVIMLPEFQLIE